MTVIVILSVKDSFEPQVVVISRMSGEKNQYPQDPESNVGASAPPSYEESQGIPINDDSHVPQQIVSDKQSQAASLGLYDRSHVFAVPVVPNYQTTGQPTQGQPIGDQFVGLQPIQAQPIETQPYPQTLGAATIPMVNTTTFVTLGCPECIQKKEAKRLRQINDSSSNSCCICVGPHSHGGECSGCDGNSGGGDSGAFVLIFLLVCCIGMLLGWLCYVCSEEEEVERCSTCGSII